MMRSTCGRMLLGAALLVVPVRGFAGTDVRVETSDGETLRGQLEAEVLEIDVRMGRASERKRIPFGDVVSTDLRKTKLRDGRVLRGKVVFESLTLATAAGRIALNAEQISIIEVIAPKAAAVAAAMEKPAKASFGGWSEIHPTFRNSRAVDFRIIEPRVLLMVTA